jgi:uncharacterized membrane protein
MSLTKIIALIFLTLMLITAVALVSTTGYEDRHVNWKQDIVRSYGTNGCIDENTYYKMLNAKSEGLCYFFDEELDWTY